ncbi:hypothetical protein C5C24_05780 [Rathayibacter sp. AY2B3]|uniref:hypothetical protein n=1 Tax=Rathayibacter sp. AY2B3 TaxID=2080569 RepID=UPI000CE7AB79|nr:hypothetical protein [Rathayibacter sp. AY2B3]PPG51988.1 hypothetical protein C5C24_05780 [Rathayibacter sp. AY2B3]
MTDTLLSLSDIAALAGVRRPTVSAWRSRARGSTAPFPAPVAGAVGSERFSAGDVSAWLAATAKGNNPEATADVLSFGRAADREPDAFDALVALRAQLGEELAAVDDLVATARGIDPGDAWLVSEIEALGPRLMTAALEADAAVEAAWTPGAAFDRARPAAPERTALDPEAEALVADIALVLAGRDATGTVVDPTGVCAALILSVGIRAGDGGEFDAVLGAPSDASAGRRARRRLAAHGVRWRDLGLDEETSGSAVETLVAQFPHEGATTTAAGPVLEAIDELLLGMPSTQRGVIIGPAAALCDRLPAAAATLRREALRDGRIRAIVRLPEGLLPAHPRQSLALWVVGPADGRVDEGRRWTLLADVGERTLDAAVRSLIVGDVFATMGRAADLRAHAFAFGRVEAATAVLAQSGSLLTQRSRGPRVGRVPFDAAAARAVRIEQLLGDVGETVADLAAEPVAADAEVASLAPQAIGALCASKALRYRAGTRLIETEIGTTGHVVLGEPELLGETERGSRRIGILEFERAHGRSARTQPGDVVFCTSPLAAMVDHEGGSVVAYPARILSIVDPDSGLVPDLLAADIAGRPPSSCRWRDWTVRRVLPERVPPLMSALSRIIELRAETERRLQALGELETLISDGAVHGSIRHPLLPTRTETAADDVAGTAQKGS